MGKIRIAVVGVGNCASSLIQGMEYYRSQEDDQADGLMRTELGGYSTGDIEVAAAFDVDRRKVGRPVEEAIFAPPNCTTRFCDVLSESGVRVRMGPILDGISPHMADRPEERSFRAADRPEPTAAEVVSHLRESGAEILVNFLPVGSERAAEFYAGCALEAGLGLVNCIPVFLASRNEWADRFTAQGLPLIGDDVKAQVGATIVHRMLVDLFRQRGVRLERTYQLNTGGNTDFLNMLNQERLESKRRSKTEAVQSVVGRRLPDEDIHIGPSDYVPWLGDNKVCFLRMEGSQFGGVPMNLELRLSVEDSPNSAGVVIDAIRCVKLALDRGVGGVLTSPSAYYCKHPPEQLPDEQARLRLEEFIQGSRER